MKKSDVLKTLTGTQREVVSSIKRMHPYIINWRTETMLILVTHFYKKGLRFKPLSTATGFSQGQRTGTIDYDKITLHNPREAKLLDIPMYLGNSTKFFTQYRENDKEIKRLSQQALS